MPGRILDTKGKCSVIVHTTGSEKRHLTVVLCVLSDGVVLPAVAVFKGRQALDFQEDGVFIKTPKRAGYGQINDARVV